MPLMDLLAGKNIAVVAHDAGGAEVVSSFLRRRGFNFSCHLEGPATRIFEKKFQNLNKAEDLDKLISDSEIIITGTSWQSDVEFEALQSAKKSRKTTVSFLDHWVNYKERFERNSQCIYPDIVIVGDAEALSIARNSFPAEQKIELINNDFFIDLKEEIHSLRSKIIPHQGFRCLFVTEPIREHALLRYGDERYWGYVEEDAIRFMLENLDHLPFKIDCLTIRPHPSEKVMKYKWVEDECSIPVSIENDKPILQHILEHDLVVGCQSMAMVIGLMAGKKVISCIPLENPKCVLPQRDIFMMRELIKDYQ